MSWVGAIHLSETPNNDKNNNKNMCDHCAIKNNLLLDFFKMGAQIRRHFD